MNPINEATPLPAKVRGASRTVHMLFYTTLYLPATDTPSVLGYLSRKLYRPVPRIPRTRAGAERRSVGVGR